MGNAQDQISYLITRPASMSPDKKEEVLDAGFQLAQKVFQGVGRDETAGRMFGEGERQQTHKLVLAYKAGVMVGFAGYNYFDVAGRMVMYLDGTIVDPDAQGMGIYGAMINHALLPDCGTMVFRTQNPRIYQGTRSCGLFRAIYPETNLSEAPEDVGQIAAELLGIIGKGKMVCPKSLVVRGSYGTNGLYVARPTTKDEGINQLFEERLDKGDGFVVVAIR